MEVVGYMDHHRVVDTVLQVIWSEWVRVVASVSAMASSSKEVAVEFGEPVLVVASSVEWLHLVMRSSYRTFPERSY